MSYFYWPYRPLPGSHLPGHSIFESPVGLLASTPVLTTNSVSMFFQHPLHQRSFEVFPKRLPRVLIIVLFLKVRLVLRSH